MAQKRFWTEELSNALVLLCQYHETMDDVLEEISEVFPEKNFTKYQLQNQASRLRQQGRAVPKFSSGVASKRNKKDLLLSKEKRVKERPPITRASFASDAKPVMRFEDCEPNDKAGRWNSKAPVTSAGVSCYGQQ